MATDEEQHRPSQAIENLEGRIHTLEQHLGPKRQSGEKHAPAPERLLDLRRNIEDLAAASEARADLLDLFTRYRSDLFPATADRFGAPSPGEKLAMVNASATSFPSTRSQLTSLESLPIPPSESLAALTQLIPRASQVALQQRQQADEVAELRARTAALLQRWHALSILGVGNCWADWEERLLRIEARVRQAEAAAAADS